MKLTRRRFLQGVGAGLLALSLSRLTPAAAESTVAGASPPEVPAYRTWEDLYRKKWTWDTVTKGTHCVDCYPGGCSWNVYAKDGVVWREEQVAHYPVIETGVPDMNPRGCQKGASFSQVMYGAERVKYPLKRAGARGSGKWQRVSWDEALGEIADHVLDVCVEDGPGHIVYDFSNIDFGPSSAAELRFFSLLGVPTMDGLAGGVFGSAFMAYAGIAYFQNQINLAAFSATLAGAILAFLWFNIPPARFWMTETGTMGLTLTLAVIAFMTDTPGDGYGVAALPIIAFPLVVTVFSNVIQVASKRLRGKKVFRIAPLHHHFEAIGWPSYKVTMRYWIIGVVCAILGMTVALLK